MKWSFYEIWNESLETRKERTLTVRDRIWASELGKSYIDRYLKMTAVPPTNPPNARSLRKFEAGNIWETIMGFVLSRAGILIDKQQWLKYEYPDLFPVTGKLDFLAGGHPDYDKAISTINQEFNWLPEFISRATLNIVEGLKNKYPDGLPKIVLEIKSCSSFMFEKYEAKNEASIQHKLQTFHYLKALDMPEGHIVYISKDDARLLEIGVFNPSNLEEIYKNDIATMTKYVKTGQLPSKEKMIVFDEMFGKFSTNWKVAYSGYLTKLYGFENQFAFDNTFKPIVGRWNRVLERVKSNKKMTDDNKLALEEMTKTGFNIDKIKEGNHATTQERT